MARGVFVTKGSDIRIRGLKINLEKGEVSHEGVDLRVDIWDHWLLIGRLAAQMAEQAHQAVIAAHAAEDEPGLGRALEEEFRQSMVAITSIAFAIDAFYASIKARIPPHPGEKLWRKNRLARHKQIGEILNRTWKIKPTKLKTIREFLFKLFQWRDWAVHPPAKFREPMYRQDIDRNVEWRFAVYRAEHAAALFGFASRLIESLIRAADRTPKELREWLAASESRLTAVRSGVAR